MDEVDERLEKGQVCPEHIGEVRTSYWNSHLAKLKYGHNQNISLLIKSLYVYTAILSCS